MINHKILTVYKFITKCGALTIYLLYITYKYTFTILYLPLKKNTSK